MVSGAPRADLARLTWPELREVLLRLLAEHQVPDEQGPSLLGHLLATEWHLPSHLEAGAAELGVSPSTLWRRYREALRFQVAPDSGPEALRPVSSPVSPSAHLARRIRARMEALWSRPVPRPVARRLHLEWGDIEADRGLYLWPGPEPHALATENLSASLSGPGASSQRADFRRAMRVVWRWARASAPWTVERIGRLNLLLLRHAPLEHPAGCLRAAGTEEGLPDAQHGALPGAEVRFAMAGLERWLGSAPVHPVERAARALERLLSIHPYPDGNGRVARLVVDGILIRSGFPPARLVPADLDLGYLFDLRSGEPTQIPPPERALEVVTRGIRRSLHPVPAADVRRGGGGAGSRSQPVPASSPPSSGRRDQRRSSTR